MEMPSIGYMILSLGNSTIQFVTFAKDDTWEEAYILLIEALYDVIMQATTIFDGTIPGNISPLDVSRIIPFKNICQTTIDFPTPSEMKQFLLYFSL